MVVLGRRVEVRICVTNFRKAEETVVSGETTRMDISATYSAIASTS